MNKKKRIHNEKEFKNKEEIVSGKKLYWKEIESTDGSGKRARYEKIVDINENTISFTQKIYDKNNLLIEIHEKYPIDKGHVKY
jgi:hypothetical protein